MGCIGSKEAAAAPAAAPAKSTTPPQVSLCLYRYKYCTIYHYYSTVQLSTVQYNKSIPIEFEKVNLNNQLNSYLILSYLLLLPYGTYGTYLLS